MAAQPQPHPAIVQGECRRAAKFLFDRLYGDGAYHLMEQWENLSFELKKAQARDNERTPEEKEKRPFNYSRWQHGLARINEELTDLNNHTGHELASDFEHYRNEGVTQALHHYVGPISPHSQGYTFHPNSLSKLWRRQLFPHPQLSLRMQLHAQRTGRDLGPNWVRVGA